MSRFSVWLVRAAAALFVMGLCTVCRAEDDAQRFQAGAAAVDITPNQFPVIVNGSFTEKLGTKVIDSLHARAIVLDDGNVKIAIVIVDSCGIIREVADPIKELASKATNIPTERILISATHTHTAPSVWPALGSRLDPNYVAFFTPLVARAIQLAHQRLKPAQVGFTSTRAAGYTHCRRWIRRSDRMIEDPFGVKNVRANMHPGFQNPDVVGPSGPVDDELSIVSFQSLRGKPIAVLSNFSMHYVGAPMLSSDYWGKFAGHLARRIAVSPEDEPCMVAMSQGTAGDLHWMDYSKPQYSMNYDKYADELSSIAAEVYKTIEYKKWAPIKMKEAKLTLGRRVPDKARLEAAQKIIAQVKAENRLPKTIPEVYAFEQQYLHDHPTRELKLQAIGVGDLGIATWPDEVCGISGLKIKLQSPFSKTFSITQANGADGYIPPPEQHELGGYITWPARSAGLIPEAESKMVETLLAMLEEVSGKPRTPLVESDCAYSQAVRQSKPVAYYRLDEMTGHVAYDRVDKQRNPIGNQHNGMLEPGHAFYLEGPSGAGLNSGSYGNRCMHFAGGRLKANILAAVDKYSVEFWFWNGFPNDVRPVTGYLFSRGGRKNDGQFVGDQLTIGGKDHHEGCLIFSSSNESNQTLSGKTVIETKTWNHVVVIRDVNQVRVYLNGNADPEIAGESGFVSTGGVSWFFAGSNDGQIGLEGKLDEVAIYNRPLTDEDAVRHYQESGRP